MKPVRSGIGWVISARKCTGVSVDGAHVSTHSGPPGLYSSRGNDGVCGGKEKTVNPLMEKQSYCTSMQKTMDPLSTPVGKAGRRLQRVVGNEDTHRHWAW